MLKEGELEYKNVVDAVRLFIHYTGAEIIMDPIEGLEHMWSTVVLDDFIEQAQEHKLPYTDLTKVFREPERGVLAEQLVEVVNGHPWYAIDMFCSYGIHMAWVHKMILIGRSDLDEYQESVKTIQRLLVQVKEKYKEYDDLRVEGKLKGKTHISPYDIDNKQALN